MKQYMITGRIVIDLAYNMIAESDEDVIIKFTRYVWEMMSLNAHSCVAQYECDFEADIYDDE